MRNIKTGCVLECYYDKGLGCCGSCFRTLEEIAEAGKRKKKNMDYSDLIKHHLLEIVEDMEDEGMNLLDEVYVMQWIYPEKPEVKFTLYIGNEEKLDFEGVH